MNKPREEEKEISKELTMDLEKLKNALKKDFNTLLVKEFTTDWREQRLVTGLQIDVMGIDNLEKAVSSLLSSQLKEVLELVQSNTEGTFTDDGGNDCWYIDKLVERFPGRYFKVKSFSRANTWHLVKRAGGEWLCDCEDFAYRRANKGTQCDHIRKCRHLKTKYHSRAKKRAVAVERAKRQLIRTVNKFVKEVRRLEWYKDRRNSAKTPERRKYYSDRARIILKELAGLKKTGQGIIKKYPELEKPEGKNGRKKIL